ncbi:hypothetical protein PF011_g28566 [Phytophthora fragariae]|uniref:Secreted protein n=1 Tax=Phytophthora fragariae TaxID=53985 RepID=A0A6A3H5F6_9STRA|nr:hypothetical protein PF011_g28566 [Phytophthora fragariae]
MMGPPAKKAAAKSAAIALVSLRAASSAVPSPDAAVGEVVADMVTSVEISEHLTTPDRAPRLAAETVPTTGTAKQRRAPQSSSRKRRRSVLQDDEDDEIEPSDDETRDGPSATFTVPACIVDSDPNMMNDGADQCTGLNSDEDSELEEEPEEEDEYASDDDWDGDWDIGSLTDEESDEEHEELPDSN